MKSIVYLPLSAIIADPDQPRKLFNAQGLEELAASIRVHGVIQPITVRDRGQAPAMIVTGERRFRAAQLAGLQEIPAIVVELSHTEALEVQIIENLQRQDVHPMEEALAFQRLQAQGVTQKQIGEKIGKGDRFIRERLALCRLEKGWQDLFMRGHMDLERAMMLVRLAPAVQLDFLKKQGISTSDLEDPEYRVHFSEWQLREYSGDLAKAPFSLEDATLNKKMGACTSCKFNSGNNPIEAKDQARPMCGLVQCYQSKIGVNFDRQLVQAQKELEEKPGSLVFYRDGNYGNRVAPTGKIAQLQDEGQVVVHQNQAREYDLPEDPGTFEEWEESEEWRYDDDEKKPSREAQEKQYQEELRKYRFAKTRWENNAQEAGFTRALIVEGDRRGQFTWVKVNNEGSQKVARQKIEEGVASLEDLRTERDRLQKGIRQQKDRIEDNTQKRLIQDFLAAPATTTDTKPLTQGDWALMAFLMLEELGGLDHLSIHLDKSRDKAFMDAISLPAKYRKDWEDDLNMDGTSEQAFKSRERAFTYLRSLTPGQASLLIRRAITVKLGELTPTSYSNSAQAWALRELMIRDHVGNHVDVVGHEEDVKAGRRLTNAQARLEKTLEDIKAMEKGKRSKTGKAKAKAKPDQEPDPTPEGPAPAAAQSEVERLRDEHEARCIRAQKANKAPDPDQQDLQDALAHNQLKDGSFLERLQATRRYMAERLVVYTRNTREVRAIHWLLERVACLEDLDVLFDSKPFIKVLLDEYRYGKKQLADIDRFLAVQIGQPERQISEEERAQAIAKGEWGPQACVSEAWELDVLKAYGITSFEYTTANVLRVVAMLNDAGKVAVDNKIRSRVLLASGDGQMEDAMLSPEFTQAMRAAHPEVVKAKNPSNPRA